MYGPQPVEQWKTVVRTNDPQRDRYGSHRKNGLTQRSLEINSQEAWVPVVNHSGRNGWKALEVKGKAGSGKGEWVEGEFFQGVHSMKEGLLIPPSPRQCTPLSEHHTYAPTPEQN